MLKNAMVSTALAVIALAASGVPAALADWTDNTTNIAAEESITLSGAFAWAAGIGGISCATLSSSWALSPGTTAQIESFAILNPAGCGTSGTLAFCSVTEATATSLPWTAHTTGAFVKIAEVTVEYTLHGTFCPRHELELRGTVKLTPDNLHAMTKGTFSENPALYDGTTGVFIQNAVMTGTPAVAPGGRYGIT